LLMVVVGCAMVVVVMNHPESVMSESTRSDDHSPDQNPSTDIPITLWKRIRCCPGMAMSDPHLYPSVPVSRLSRCYPYPCHALCVLAPYFHVTSPSCAHWPMLSPQLSLSCTWQCSLSYPHYLARSISILISIWFYYMKLCYSFSIPHYL
jgi:hypothetical protein